MPGLVTGLLLNPPLCMRRFVHFARTREPSPPMAATSLAIGASYDIRSDLSHRARSAPSGRNTCLERCRMTMHDTLALIEGYYAAFNRGDWNAMLDRLADDVVHDLNQGPRERGRDAFRAFLARMDRSYSEQLRDIAVCANPDGTRAAAEYVVHGTYKVADDGLPPAHGQTYVLPGGAFFEVRDGRIARVTNCYNLQDWLAQVGAA